MGTMGCTKNCETWQRSFLGTLIMIQEEPISRTMWGPSFGHIRTTFWPFLGKGEYGLKIVKFGMDHLWAHWLWFKKNQSEGPCEDYVLAIKGPYFSHFKESALQVTPSNVIFGMEHPLAQWLGWRKNQFHGPCEDHVLGIKGPLFGHF